MTGDEVSGGSSDVESAPVRDVGVMLDELVATGERAELKSRIAQLLDRVDQAIAESELPRELALAVLASDVYTRLDDIALEPLRETVRAAREETTPTPGAASERIAARDGDVEG